MFDFEAIGRAGAALETGLRDLDSRLEQISNQQKVLIALTAIGLVSNSEGPEKILAQADELASRMRDFGPDGHGTPVV